jgi:hypothetical protein
MGDVLKIGRRYSGDPIAPVPEHTSWVEAGGLRFGVEFRVLNDEIIDQTFGERPETQVGGVLPPQDLAGFDSRGVSIHVCDARDGGEYLRFDAFDGDPHYHYLTPGEGHTVVVFDDAALGDMFPWTLGCLRDRLPQMLALAGAADLADRVDVADVHAVLPEIERLAVRAFTATPSS